MTGQILHIQRFCTQDGPGIRTTVFLKGCPLNCIWCSNPESQKYQTEYALSPEGQVIRQFGYPADANEIISEVLLDEPYYRHTEGGLTVSGGEPAVQWRFTRELLRLAKKHQIGTLVETAGAVSWRRLGAVVEYADIVYFDLKLASAKTHKRFVGTDNRLILNNLRRTSEQSDRLVVRIPLIPGVNDTEEELTHLAKVIQSLPKVERIGVLPYHRFGENKYALLNREYKMGNAREPSKESIAGACAVLSEAAGKEVCIGI